MRLSLAVLSDARIRKRVWNKSYCLVCFFCRVMQRDEAIAFVCGPLCLQIHPVLPLAMQPVKVQNGSIEYSTDVVTWLAKGARFYTLIRTNAGTRVYDHEEDTLYYANPNTELHRECPDGYAFLCQTVCDRQSANDDDDTCVVPRLLVMDLVCPRMDNPRERGDTLRRMAPLLPHVCHVQWAGERTALEQFVSSGSVPHDVETIVALRGPLQLSREPATGIAALNALTESCILCDTKMMGGY